MSLPRVSPRRRRSMGLTERNLNNFDDDNLTLPATLKPKKRGVSIGGDLASSSSLDGLSDMQRLRRAARPRKSILKLATPEDEENTANFAETIDFGSLYKSRQSLGPSRRVSFAPSAHVRMFEKDAKKPRRKSSMGMGMMSRQPESPAKSSLPPMPKRRSSIQSAPPPPVAQQYFVGEGEGGGEESMEIESDDSADSDEILAEITALSPGKPISDELSDSEDEMSMDETVIGGGIVQWDEAETASEDDSGSDMDISHETIDDEKTMDFTVALGGVVPIQPPQNAKRNRHSIGYSHPLEPGMEPLRPGDSDGADYSAEMEMEETAVYGGVYGGMHEDSTISSGDSTVGADHTATYTLSGGMDFTEVGGGIVGRESTVGRSNMSYTMGGGMDFTDAGGVIIGQQHTMAAQTTASYTTSGGMDFTEAGGGIAYQNTEMYGRTMTTNIFAPQPPPQPTPAPAAATTPKNLSSSTRIPRPVTNPDLTVEAPRNPFAPPPSQQAEKPTMKNIFAPTPAPQETPGKQKGRRMSTPRAPTPARPQAMSTPKSPAAKLPGTPKGTPSFARPTASSVKKAELGKSPAKSTAKSPAKASQKRNVFAPSPDEPSRTPKSSGMQAAASVAKKLDFTPISTPGRAATPAKTPGSKGKTPLAASVQPTPLSTPGKRKREAEEDEEEEAPSRKQQAIEAPEPRDSTATESSEPTPTPPLGPGPSPASKPEPSPSRGAEPSSHKTSQSLSTERSLSLSSSAELTPASAEPSPSLPEVRVKSPDAQLQEPEGPEEAEDEEATEEVEEAEEDEEDMSLEEDEASEREVTPEPERPLPTFTPTPRRSLGRPRPSLGTPMRVLSANTASLSLDREPSPPPREPTPEPSGPVPLSVFLEAVGVRFLDDMNPHLPQPRRSSFAPRGPQKEDQLHDFAAANLESIFLHMYEWAIGRMASELSHGREEVASTTRVCDAENPPVVRDYYECSAEERDLYESTLRNFKTKSHLEAKGGWYDWRLGLMDRIRPDVAALHAAMADEAERHALNAEVAEALLPDLAQRHAALEAELDANRAQVAEITQCDPTELADLKDAIVEQEGEISRFSAELEAKTRQLEELESEAAALDQAEREHEVALSVAKGMCDEYTSSDVRRLRAELSALGELHGWRVVTTSPLEMVYAGELVLRVPDPASPSIALLDTAAGPTECLLELTRLALARHLERKPSLASVIQATGQLWTAARRLRAELQLLDLYYPASYAFAKTLQCSARLMMPRAKSRANLTFHLGPETLLRWPEPSAFEVQVEGRVVYGKAEVGKLEEAARETLLSAIPHVPGVLLQACVEAAGLYK